jgi:hypothetical protein
MYPPTFQLIYMGREYPANPALFQTRVHNVFMKNKDETDPEKIQELVPIL